MAFFKYLSCSSEVPPPHLLFKMHFHVIFFLNFLLEAACSSLTPKSWLLQFLLLFRSNGELFILGDSWISNFSRAGGLDYPALALSPPGGTKATGVKMLGAIVSGDRQMHTFSL
jgi:hypothetical protein